MQGTRKSCRILNSIDFSIQCYNRKECNFEGGFSFDKQEYRGNNEITGGFSIDTKSIREYQ